MVDMRWENEMEEAMELIYRIQTDHGGKLPESEAREQFGAWVAAAAERAERLSWLVAKGSPAILTVTYGGRKALDAALASRNTAPSPHWFGGSIPSVQSPTGPVLPAQSYKPYEELKQRALEQGVLTQEDVDRVARSKRREPEEPGEYRTLDEQIFPGTRVFAGSLQYEEGHPFGGGFLDPAGHEGPYQVTATLTRRGAPDVPFVYVTDAYMMEGDSHLRLVLKRREDGAVGVPFLVYRSSEGEETQFELLANQQGRLGQIRTVLRAESMDDARKRAYRLLNPFLCDLSYRYDVPIQVLQTNVVELATLVMSGIKQDDFREKAFDPEQFLDSEGLAYEVLPNYEFFTRLYREGANTSSVDYGFLCFYRIAEGVIELRRKRIIEGEGKLPKDVPGPSVISDDEVVEGKEASEAFPPDMLGESLWKAFKSLEDDRVKVGHAFLHSEDPVSGHANIIAERLEGEEQAARRHAQARFLARRMLETEYFATDEPAHDQTM